MKKNSIKKVLALMLVLILAMSLFTACGGGETASTPAPSQSQQTPSESQKPAESTKEDTPTATTEEPKDDVSSLPLCEEKTTLTLWVGISSNVANVVDNMADTAFFRELEERTNVHIEFQHPSSGGEAQAFNLMISSNDLPDMIRCSDSYPYPGGMDQAVEDGYFLDLTDLVPQYCPNFLKAAENYASQLADPDLYMKSIKTEDGRIVTIGQIMTVPQGDFAGYYFRKDWLDDLGLDEPVTYEDWEQALTKFKEEKGATAPLLLQPSGYDGFNSLSAGYGVPSSFYQIDGTIHYGPMDDGWKDYMTMLSRWYANGLIDPDYMSSPYWPDQAMIVTGKAGAFFTMYTLIAMYENGNEDPGALYVPVPSPVKQPGDKNMFAGTQIAGTGIVISQDSKNAELCLKWLNYLYSEEGSLFANYGIEGDTFEYVDGVPQYNEKVTANEQYSFSEAMCYYTMPSGYLPNLQDWRRELASVPAKDTANYDVFPSNKVAERTIPNVQKMMNAEEATEYAKLNADVSTIMAEATAGFITGTKSLGEWDDYVSKLKTAGIDRLIEIVQGAYDRFTGK